MVQVIEEKATREPINVSLPAVRQDCKGRQGKLRTRYDYLQSRGRLPPTSTRDLGLNTERT